MAANAKSVLYSRVFQKLIYLSKYKCKSGGNGYGQYEISGGRHFHLGPVQGRKKLVSWVSWIPRNISQNVKIEEHSVKIKKNFVAFYVK